MTRKTRSVAAFDAWCSTLDRTDLIKVKCRLIDLLSVADKHIEPQRQADPYQWDSCLVFWPAIGICLATGISYWNWM